MRRSSGAMLIISFIVALQCQAFAQSTRSEKKETGNVPKTVLDFTMNNIDGKPVPVIREKSSIVPRDS